MRLYRLLTLLILTVCGIPYTSALAPMLRATLPTEVMMGDTVTMKLQLVKDRNAKGDFPGFEGLKKDMRHTECGDTIEIGRITPVDTVDIGSGRMQINFTATVQAFDPGVYEIPGIRYAEGNDTVSSEPFVLNVKEFEIPDDATLLDYKPIADAPKGNWTDKIPDSLYNLPQHLKKWWWAYLIGLLIVGGGIWLYIYYKKNGTILPQKPKLTPYELAVWQLQKLKEKRLLEEGQIKDYYSELTDILRVYISNRFGMNALEMTTAEFANEIDKVKDLKNYRHELMALLEEADFVKFAKFSPGNDENIRAFDTVARFVEDTKPMEPEEEKTPQRKVATRGKSKIKLSRRQRLEIEKKKGGPRHDA